MKGRRIFLMGAGLAAHGSLLNLINNNHDITLINDSQVEGEESTIKKLRKMSYEVSDPIIQPLRINTKPKGSNITPKKKKRKKKR